MARLYADENFPVKVVKILRDLGHDVVTTHDAGRSNQRIPDEQVLADAMANKRAVLTHNRRDYIRLHRASERHCGIVVCTDNPNDAELAERIDRALRSRQSLEGELIRVYRPG
jgi:predicted nuclease of predicted toxin-antitoxin system